MAEEKIDFAKLVLSDLSDFVEHHFVNESGLPIKLSWYQEKFISDVLRNVGKKYVFVASTRSGKTEATAVLGTLRAILNDGEEVVIVAPWYKQAERMFKRIRNYFLSNRSLYKLLDFSRGFRRDEINLVNGSVIRCLSAANAEALLGHGATFLIVDEAGSIPDEVLRTRILRMLAAAKARGHEGVLVLLGTPHQMNFMYEAYCSEEFKKYKVTWRDAVQAGIISQEEVDYARKVMSDEEFRVWFEAEFISRSDTLYNPKDISMCMVGSLLKNYEVGYDYFAGLDIARFGDDESALVVVRLPSSCSFEESVIELVWYKTRSKKPINDTIGWALKQCEKWKVKALAIDVGGLGSGAYDVLRERFGEVIYGVSLLGDERRDVYFTLQQLIEERRIVLPKNDEALKRQFSSFTIQYTSDGKARIIKTRGMRDDIVDALALACYCAKRRRSGEGEFEYVGDIIRL